MDLLMTAGFRAVRPAVGAVAIAAGRAETTGVEGTDVLRCAGAAQQAQHDERSKGVHNHSMRDRG